MGWIKRTAELSTEERCEIPYPNTSCDDDKTAQADNDQQRDFLTSWNFQWNWRSLT